MVSRPQVARNWIVLSLAGSALCMGAASGYLAGWAFWQGTSLAVIWSASVLGIGLTVVNAPDLFLFQEDPTVQYQKAIEMMREILLFLVEELHRQILEARYLQMES